MDILLMLVTALGCAFIGWAVIYFVSESRTVLNTGRRPFAASASAAGPEELGAQRTRRGTERRITTRRSSTAARSRRLMGQ
jgi:hypothetical protein